MRADDATKNEIITLLYEFAEAFSKRDLEGIMSYFAPDDDVVVYGAEPDEKRIGVDQIKTILTQNWSVDEDVFLELEWVSVSVAGPVACVAADACVKVDTAGQHLLYPSRVTAVLEKRGDKWLIIQGHFSFPALIPHLRFF